MLLVSLARCGITVTPTGRGARLRVEGPGELLGEDLRTVLLTRKAELLALLGGKHEPQHWARLAAAVLSEIPDVDLRVGLRERFEERAGILEFEAGLGREAAEERAFHDLLAGLVQHWTNRVPDDLGERKGKRTS
jgi:hypothetical protein